LTAHHREDQAETYLMRRRAGSGPDGLAAMSAVRELPGCRLVRPLLAVPRDRLAALLAAEGQPFLSDPSNANPAFERTRLRLSTQNQPLSRSAGEGGSGRSLGTGEGTGHRQVPHPPAAVPPVPPLPRCGRELLGGAETETRAYARKRIAREAVLDALVGRAVTLHLAGFAAIDAAAITGFDGEVVERLLARVAACIGGGRYPARRDRVSRLRNRLAATPQCARTLGGCRFVPWRGQILVMRELAAAAPPQRLQPGETVAWDRRFEARLIAEATGAPTLGYLGQGGERLTERYRSNVPRLLHSVLPALWDEQGLVAVPSVGYRRPAIEPLPCVWFHPANPLSRAGFTVV
jgi:tRNA(Ile)-lysidine synthase